MTTTAVLVALLHCLTFRSPVQAEFDGDYMVRPVYEQAGLNGVAVVSCESQWNPKAQRKEPRGHTSFGLWELDDEWHPQFRDDIAAHIRYGAAFWNKKLSEALGNMTLAVRIYNSGSRTGGLEWADRVAKKRDSLAFWTWRHLR